MSAPKVTYDLMGQSLEIAFSKLQYANLKQGWKKDRILFINPFTGKKDPKVRGWYYHAEVHYEGMKDTDFLTLRDLFNKNMSGACFYPNDIEVRNFPCEINADGIDFEDKHPDLEVNVTITFDSVDRYDSPMSYPSNYWGTRDVTMEADIEGAAWATQRTELQTADSNNLTSLSTRSTNFGDHLAAANPHPGYYTKTEFDTLVGRVVTQNIFMACAAVAGSGYLSTVSGIASDALGALVLRAGTITKIRIRHGTNTLSFTPTPIPVLASSRISAYIKRGSGVVTYMLVENGKTIWNSGAEAVTTVAAVGAMNILIEGD